MTLGYSVSFSAGRVAASEYDQFFDPRTPRTGTLGVVLCHGSGNPQAFVDVTNQPSSAKLAAALASAGMPCVAGDFGGQTWANDTSMNRIDSAIAALRARYPTIRTDKFALLGGSMGGAIAARYCQLHPTRIAAMVGLIPLLDLKAFYNANVGGSQAEVAGAWGVSTGAALPSSADIATNASLAASVPLLVGYSTVDTTVLPPWVLSYVAAVRGTAVVTDSTYGHSDQAIGGMPISTIGRFLVTYGA